MRWSKDRANRVAGSRRARTRRFQGFRVEVLDKRIAPATLGFSVSQIYEQIQATAQTLLLPVQQ